MQKGELVQDLNIAAFTSDGLYYAATDGIAMTLKNSPFAQSFMMLTHTCYNSGDDIRRARLAVDAYGGIKVFDDRTVSGTGGTWHTVLTDKNTKITNGTITINGTSITPLVQHQSLANYVTTNTAQNITGVKTFINGLMPLSKGLPWGAYQDGLYGTRIYQDGIAIRPSASGSDAGWLRMIETTANSGQLELAIGDDGNEPIYVRGYNTSGSVTRAIILLDASGNQDFNTVSALALKKKGGTSSQFLMADGSVKALSDITSAYVTALRVTGDALTWVKNGLGNNITLPFAAESKTLRSQGMLTAVTEKTLHGAGVKLYEAYNNGYPTTYGNVLAVQGSAHMGAGELLLGWSGGDGTHASLYYRNHRDNTSTANWSAWATILDSVNFNSVIGSNLTAYVKKSGDTMTGALNLANATWNKIGDDAYLGDCNVAGCIGIKGATGNPGFQFYKSDGTGAGKMTTDGNLLWNSNKIWHQGNDGPGSGLDADLWDGEQLSNFRMRKVYTLNLGSLSTSNFYPVTFGKSAWEMDCEIHSPSRGGSEAYNQNHIHFILTAQGWSDTVARLLILSQGNFDNGEITIGAIGTGNQNGERCVWLRGGMNYTVIANAVPTLRTADYSDGNEKYTVGTSLYGGTNASVTIRWQNTNTLRDNAKAATLQSNVASATKLQTARTLWGRSFDGTGNVDGAMTVNYSGVISGISLYRKETGSGAFISFYGANQTANYFRIGMAGDGHFSMCYNGGADALSISTGGNVRVGYVNDSYKLATSSFICNSWIRTVGSAGWYSETYGGGWCMTDSTWIRIHGGKSLYAASGIIRTDGELQVGGGGDKFRVTAAGAVTATSFTKRGGTAAQALMADGSVRRVITFDDLADDGGISVSDFDAALANGLVSVSALTEWDGRVHWTKANQSSQTGTTEIYNCNLQYCALGKLGDVVTHSHSEYLLAANLLKKTSVGDIGWGTAANQQKPLAMSAIAFWNGAYQGTSSNLAYCNKGAFGTMATKNADDYVTRTTAQTISGVKTFSGEQRFAATGLSYTDPWSGIDCAIKVTGKVGVTDSIKALSFIKAGGTFTQVLMADGNVRAVWLTKAAAISESGMAVTFNNTDGGDSEQMVDGFGLSAWNGASITAAGVRQSRLAYCVKGAFGDIVTHNASEFLTSGSLSGYVTKNTAQEISGAKTFTASMTARAITPQTSGTYNLGSTTSHWNHIFCRRLYVTTGGSESLPAAGLGTAVGLGWIELRSAGTPYIDFTGSNSTADYNVRLAYQNSQLEVNGANFSVANTIRSKAYIGMIFDYIGSTAKANTYGVMFYKCDKYFNIVRTKKGAPDTPTSDHGGSLMELNLATNAVTFTGVVTASNISTSSDARLKTRIADISLPIADIAAAPLWRYRRKDTGVVDVGSTAQYWGAILPELTRTDEQGWMSLDYGKTALLASVSLARKADDHEARIKALEAENARLREKIARLEAA